MTKALIVLLALGWACLACLAFARSLQGVRVEMHADDWRGEGNSR